VLVGNAVFGKVYFVDSIGVGTPVIALKLDFIAIHENCARIMKKNNVLSFAVAKNHFNCL
jgi:hypothetical protein